MDFLLVLLLCGCSSAMITPGYLAGEGTRPGYLAEEAARPGYLARPGCVPDTSTGLCCVEDVREVEGLQRRPLLECTHREVEQCHYSYVTQYSPSQEEVCEEDFQKSCSITFRLQAYNETVRRCDRPVEKVCSGQGQEQCSTVYETSCSTKYTEKSPGKYTGDTMCQRLPLKLCGAGCVFEEMEEECRDEVVEASMQVPHEVCDLEPVKRCSMETRLVPRLEAVPECAMVPRETCRVSLGPKQRGTEGLKSRWCFDPSTSPTAPDHMALSPYPTNTPSAHMEMGPHPSLPVLTPRVETPQPEISTLPRLPAYPDYQEEISLDYLNYVEPQSEDPIPFVGTYGVASMLSDNVRTSSSSAPALTFLDNPNSLDTFSAPSPPSFPVVLPPLDRGMLEARRQERRARGVGRYTQGFRGDYYY